LCEMRLHLLLPPRTLAPTPTHRATSARTGRCSSGVHPEGPSGPGRPCSRGRVEPRPGRCRLVAQDAVCLGTPATPLDDATVALPEPCGAEDSTGEWAVAAVARKHYCQGGVQSRRLDGQSE